jgi:hypothetical protein
MVVPTLTAVTVPLFTVATPGLLIQNTFLFIASVGNTVAVSVSVLPTVRLVDVLLRLTLLAVTLGLFPHG